MNDDTGNESAMFYSQQRKHLKRQVTASGNAVSQTVSEHSFSESIKRRKTVEPWDIISRKFLYLEDKEFDPIY